VEAEIQLEEFPTPEILEEFLRTNLRPEEAEILEEFPRTDTCGSWDPA
jgi:hypothetical protein